MHEITLNLHMHTRYSDGSGTHEELAMAAMDAGVDAILVTDHNIWVDGVEGYFRDGDRQTLLLVGEEIHDRNRDPQGNHLLVIGAGQELSRFASDPQQLLDQTRKLGGITYLAHPFESPAPAIGEPALSWFDWDIHGFTGIEIWNEMSELKSRLRTKLHGLLFAFFPAVIARGPEPETVQKWDALLAEGKKVVAIGGTDAHAFLIKAGPLRKTVFPYRFHFRALNMHLLLPEPLKGELTADRRQILDALRSGRGFIGYDLPARTHGFRFSAHGKDGKAWMGDEISSSEGVTFQIKLPRRANCRLLKDGKTVRAWRGRATCTHITSEAGVYRVEVDIRYLGRTRSWIISNPIYIKDG
jgi:hypothetical protein